MTRVEIKYNPFVIKTEIRINGEEIAQTSNLYRYRNTPFEDWIEIFIPELVKYCNDDELTISIISIPKYIKDVMFQVDNYCSKHKEIDIEIKECVKPDYASRVEKIRELKERIGISNQIDKSTEDVRILFVSLADEEEYRKMIMTLVGEDLNLDEGHIITNYKNESDEKGFHKERITINTINDSFLNIKFILFPYWSLFTNDYFDYLRMAINKDDDYMLVMQLNSEPIINEKIYNLIENQLEKKGKKNRSRYIFISENVVENRDYIKMEYGVRDTVFVDENKIDNAFLVIKEYLENVYHSKKIIHYTEELRKGIQNYQKKKTREIIEKEIDKEKENFKYKITEIMDIYDSFQIEFPEKECIDKYANQLLAKIIPSNRIGYVTTKNVGRSALGGVVSIGLFTVNPALGIASEIAQGVARAAQEKKDNIKDINKIERFNAEYSINEIDLKARVKKDVLDCINRFKEEIRIKVSSTILKDSCSEVNYYYLDLLDVVDTGLLCDEFIRKLEKENISDVQKLEPELGFFGQLSHIKPYDYVNNMEYINLRIADIVSPIINDLIMEIHNVTDYVLEDKKREISKFFDKAYSDFCKQIDDKLDEVELEFIVDQEIENMLNELDSILDI